MLSPFLLSSTVDSLSSPSSFLFSASLLLTLTIVTHFFPHSLFNASAFALYLSFLHPFSLSTSLISFLISFLSSSSPPSHSTTFPHPFFLVLVQPITNPATTRQYIPEHKLLHLLHSEYNNPFQNHTMRIEHPSSVRLAAALLIMTLASSSSPSSYFTSAVNTLNINNHETFSPSHNDEPFALPPSLPPHIQQNLHHSQHQQLLKRHSPSSQSHTLSKRAAPQGWIDYYSSTGAFIDESILTSASCLTLPSTWGIIDITLATRPNPANNERDVLQLFNDKNCITVNREPATQTGWVLIAMYFNKVPQSLQWVRTGASTTTTTTTTTTSSQSVAPTASSSSSVPTQTLSVSSSSLPSPSPTAQTPPPDGITNPQPSHHTTFPNALIPPKPLPDSSSSSAWGDNCGGPQNDPDSPGCKGARQVSHILITGITIALVVVALMAAGSFYIYRRFYANALPTTTTGNSSSYRSNQQNNHSQTGGGGGGGGGSYAFSGTHNMNSSVSGSGTRSGSGTASGTGTGTGTGRQLGDDANPDYEYCHDQDENEPPRFMFDHRHDNVNTNRNPRLFNEGNNNTNTLAAPTSIHYPNNSSDISLIERVRK